MEAGLGGVGEWSRRKKVGVGGGGGRPPMLLQFGVVAWGKTMPHFPFLFGKFTKISQKMKVPKNLSFSLFSRHASHSFDNGSR